MRFAFLMFLSAFVANDFCSSIHAEPPQVQRLLPDTTVAFLRVEPIETLMAHPVFKTVRGSDAFKTVWRTPNVMKVRGGITLLEFALGDKVETLVGKLSAEGVYLAVDKKTQGVIALACTESSEWADEYVKKLVKLARTDAQNKKQPDPVKEAEYRGIQGYEFQNVVFGTLGSVVIVTNKSELAKDVIDRHLDSTNDSLENTALFRKTFGTENQASSKEAGQAVASGFVDLDTLRDAGVANDLLGKKQKDFGAELLIGGVLATLQHTSFATGDIRFNENGIGIEFATPHESAWTLANHSFFVGPDGHGVAPLESGHPNLLVSAQAYRNLAEMWLRAGDLFDEKVNDQLAQADSTLTTLFSGKDFGTDILGAIEPQIQFVAAEQSFENGNTPAIQLPGFALIAKLKDAGMKKELKRTFQSFIGFLNVAGAMEGQPQLDLDSETIDGLQMYSGTYLRDEDRKYENGLPIQFNFSPTLAFEGDTVFISSTSSLAKDLAAAKTSAQEPNRENTIVTLNVAPIRKALEQNRQQLISQNMLEKGHTKTEAENEIDVLMNALALLKAARLSLQFDELAKLKLDVQFNSTR